MRTDQDRALERIAKALERIADAAERQPSPADIAQQRMEADDADALARQIRQYLRTNAWADQAWLARTLGTNHRSPVWAAAVRSLVQGGWVADRGYGSLEAKHGI